MPPKKDDKKKLSKKEKEALEKARLEEEARLAAEQAQKEREMREQKEKEAKTKFFSERGESIKESKQEILMLKQKHQQFMSEYEKQQWELGSWHDYVGCSYLPHPQDMRDMNTFFSILKGESVFDADNLTFDKLNGEISTLNELGKRVFSYVRSMGGNSSSTESLLAYMNEIYEITLKKLDYTTAYILQHTDLFETDSSENFQLATDLSGIHLCIWGNITKNPRFKNVEFSSQGISLVLPKQVIMENTAIRVIHDNSSEALYALGAECEKNGFRAVDGILFLDLVELPEMSKNVWGWKVRPILNKEFELVNVEFPIRRIAENATEEENPETQNETKDDSLTPLQVTIKLSKDLIMIKDHLGVYYFNEKKELKNEEISEVVYTPVNNSLSFKTMVFRPIAIVTPLDIEFPFTNWTVEPTTEGTVQINLLGQISKISIEIFENGCMLKEPVLTGCELNISILPPEEFFDELKKTGLVFTKPMKEGKSNKKKMDVVEEITSCIALLGNVVAFRRCAESGLVGTDKGCVEYSLLGNEERQWRTVFVDAGYTHEKEDMLLCQIVDHVDADTKIDFAADGVQGNVYHLLKPADFEPPNARLFSNVRKVIEITGMFEYS